MAKKSWIHEMKASKLDFTNQNFNQSEWPSGALEQMNASVIEALFELRSISGVRMSPSSLLAAHIRSTKGKGRHCLLDATGVPRLSDATDIHVPTIHDMLKLLNFAPQVESIGGFGIYYDTNTPMFHIDCRPRTGSEPLIWLRDKQGKYTYLQSNRKQFYSKL